MSPAAPICRHPNDSLPTPPASDATPYPTRRASEAATSETYATWFDSASGRYPAADSHASARPATAVSVARNARPRTSPDARLSANTAAIGRNHGDRTRARAGPRPRRPIRWTSRVPTLEPRAAASAAAREGRNGRTSSAPTTTPPAVSPMPRRRAGAARIRTATRTRNAGTIPGKKETPTASATPRPDDEPAALRGASASKADSSRSARAGSAASATRTSTRPSEKAHITTPDRA